ncbi:MAG: hypothetical protein ACYTBJ_09590 [Planctomycetota bacterium]|jgi:hypothetical protein
MSTVKGFWQHENGKIYAIESDSFGKIIAGAGPVDPNNLRDLEDYHYTKAIADWLREAIAQHKLRRINPSKAR